MMLDCCYDKQFHMIHNYRVTTKEDIKRTIYDKNIRHIHMKAFRHLGTLNKFGKMLFKSSNKIACSIKINFSCRTTKSAHIFDRRQF